MQLIQAVRDALQRNQTMAIVIMTGCIGIALVVAVTRSMGSAGGRPPVKVPQAWYLDTVTGETFPASPEEIPPITSPQGNPAVKIKYYICPGRGNEKFIGYYEKFTEEGRELMVKATEEAERGKGFSGMAPHEIEAAHLRQSVDGENWFAANDPKFTSLFLEKIKCPDGGRAMPWFGD